MSLKIPPRDSVHGLTEAAITDAILPCEVSQLLACREPLSAVANRVGGEFGVWTSLAPDDNIISDSVLVILLHSAPAEVRQGIIVPTRRTMSSFNNSWRSLADECDQYEDVHIGPLGPVVLSQCHHQVLAGPLGDRVKQVRPLAPALRAVRRMVATHPAKVGHLVPLFEVFHRKPAFRSCRALKRLQGWAEYLTDERAHRPVLLVGMLNKRHSRPTSGASPRLQDPARNSSLGAVARRYHPVQAADPAFVTDLVQPLPVRDGQPPLRIVGRHGRLFHGRRLLLRQGPGSGARNTVRAAIKFQSIIAYSYAISAVTGQGDS